MLRRSLLVLAVPLAVLVASWGCASSPPRGDPQRQVVGNGTPQTAHSQLEQQLAALAIQLTSEFSTHQINRVAVLPFENTTGQKPDSLGTYLAEKITHLLVAKRPATALNFAQSLPSRRTFRPPPAMRRISITPYSQNLLKT